MADSNNFNYGEVFSEKSEDSPLVFVNHAKYDFNVAYPSPETLPIDGLIQSLQTAVDSRGDEIARELAYYPHALGSRELREFVVEKLNTDRNFLVGPDDIVLTAGSGEAIALLIQAITNPGDVVLTERYVYGGTLSQLRRFGADVVGVPLDEDGLIPEALDDLIKQLKLEGRSPKWLYTIAEHQNPTGSTLPVERRQAILKIAHDNNFPILEDECYVDLRFKGERQPAFRALDESGIVLHVASFSKLLAPGLRLGYFVVPDEVKRRALGFKVGAGPNQFAAYAISGYLKDNLNKHRDDANQLLKRKRDAMDESLADHFGNSGAKWSRPNGGCYTWLEMPENTDLNSIRDDVFEGGVGYQPGVQFSPDGGGKHAARLCFGFETPEKNYDGIALLSELFKKHGVM